MFKSCARFCVALAALVCALSSIAAHDDERMQRTIVQRFGPDAARALHDWRDMLAQAAALPEADKLRRVNDFFNRRITFQDDIVVWGQDDYWATPLEMLGKGAGDCEDFVIGKYFSLIELGVPASQMRMTYVRARIGGPQSSITQAHMVLSYYVTPNAEPLVLDSLISEIRPASRRPDLTPVFSFNSDGVFMAGATAPSSPVDRLSRWKDLLLKMKAEGYEP
ncbi:MAG TPA: transglutaminase-like cysteine peptidase [Rhodocyclaceae bacterium]|nr:transglutaminase-like cysteine peptidase [Rhodocyclaceae bacterium]